ncbi:MAG: Ppx/GppA family phosphatase [Bacteroidia bacterium]|nr:Ppx/GppA family phosphatase [Bacteroidia bacterium]MCX7764299.1 Ppx/GppA family phosphatase [Bacteroidia bacterium]MDW8057467.1 Ppx/GppA phosphatase family protein [Bacteroidia bacterium]
MPKKVAAFDLGTNSFHLLTAFIDEQKQEVRIERRRREFVFLGRELQGEPPSFSEAGMERAVETLRQLMKEAQQAGAQVFLAYGTEAFRRAANASILIETFRQELGLEVRLLSGAEEARLIHEGVKNGLLLPEEPYLVMDIGGGSVEFIWGQGGEIKYLFSVPLGVTLLQQQYPEPDPLSPSIVEAIQAQIQETLSGHLRTIPRETIHHLIGTSGTFKTIARLVAHHSGDSSAAQTVHGYRFGPMLFYPVYQKLLTLPLSARLQLKGMQAERAPLLPYGAILIHEVLRLFPIQTITISDYALREGIVYDYAQQLFDLPALSEKPLRERTIQALGEKYQISSTHAELARKWAEELFDLLRPLHQLGNVEREWLAYAAYLHDIGHFINPSGHHKHGLYILLNSPMPGFSSEELLLMANLVRYHRKSLPSSEHYHYSALPRSQKKLIGLLAPLLRLSDLMAKYLQHAPTNLTATIKDTQVELSIPTPNASAVRHLPSIYAEVQDFFERSYNRRLVLQLAWVPAVSS